VAVIDLQLTTRAPGEGLELLALIKELCPATRTMILTAYASPEARIHAQRLGADALLQKSQSLGQVLDVVRSLLGPEHGVERKH
jgi:DNA-binding NarL/FixJ family response regulator